MLSLIVPVYRNESSLPDLLEAVKNLSDQSIEGFEAVFVVDGSPDKCYELLRDALPLQRFSSQLVLLSKNFGAFIAIRTGLQFGRGERFAVMAADLQEPPSMVLAIDRILRAGTADVVIGVREGREDPFFSRLASHIFWSCYRKYVIPEIPAGGVDIFGCNKQFRDTLLTLEERHSSLIGQIFWLGYRREIVTYTRQSRRHGTSAWTLRKKINYMMDSVFSFTDLPIRVLIRAGAGGALAAALFSVVVLFARAAGFIAVPGYAMTILVIAFLGCLNLLGLGIVGSYAWRTYENTKRRPLAIPFVVNSFEVEDERRKASFRP